jgi:hypothetical protein
VCSFPGGTRDASLFIWPHFRAQSFSKPLEASRKSVASHGNELAFEFDEKILTRNGTRWRRARATPSPVQAQATLKRGLAVVDLRNDGDVTNLSMGRILEK